MVLEEVEGGVGITSLYGCCDWLHTGCNVKEEVLAGGYHPSILAANGSRSQLWWRSVGLLAYGWEDLRAEEEQCSAPLYSFNLAQGHSPWDGAATLRASLP